MERLSRLTKSGQGAVAALELEALHNAVTGTVRPLSDIAGSSVLAIAGLADPESFARQMRGVASRVVYGTSPTTTSTIRPTSHSSRVKGVAFDHALCTMKDAVKLGPRWPREAPPLWYVSLRCEIEVGRAEVSALLDRVLAARTHTQTGA
jgi:tetraacyldisaccharide 4'-kinase